MCSINRCGDFLAGQAFTADDVYVGSQWETANSGSADRERRLHVCLAKDQQLAITVRAITPHRTRSAIGLRA